MADEDFDTTTNAASSAADQTLSSAPEVVSPDQSPDGDEGAAGASADTNEEGVTGEEQVPFHEHPRWQQVQKHNADLKAKLADLEPFADIVQGFKDQGFTDAGAIRAAIEEQQAQNTAQEQAQAIETRRTSLAQELLARVNDPDDDMTPGEAEAAFRAAQLEWQIEEISRAGQSTRIEAQTSALAAKYPQMDKETVTDLLTAGKLDRAEAAARRSHERGAQIAEQAVARYNAEKAKAPKPVESAGGGVAGGKNINAMSRAEFLEYDKQLTRAAQRG